MLDLHCDAGRGKTYPRQVEINPLQNGSDDVLAICQAIRASRAAITQGSKGGSTPRQSRNATGDFSTISMFVKLLQRSMRTDPEKAAVNL